MDTPGSNKMTRRAALTAHVERALIDCTKAQTMLLEVLSIAEPLMPNQTELSLHRINVRNDRVKASIEKIKTCVAEIDIDLK